MSEPSQFLNEMTLELIEDLSPGASWLSYARSKTTLAAGAAQTALRGESQPAKPKNLYTGKTYNNAEAIAEFFKKKDITPRAEEREKGRNGEEETPEAETRPVGSVPNYRKTRSEISNLRSQTPNIPDRKPERTVAANSISENKSGLIPGSSVKHEKYGRGLVLRREVLLRCFHNKLFVLYLKDRKMLKVYRCETHYRVK